MSFAVGLDIGGTNLKAGIVRGDGELVDEWRAPARAEEGGAVVLQNMLQLARKSIDSAAFNSLKNSEEFLGLGIGTPGCVDHATGKLVWGADNLPGLVGTEFGRIFGAEFSCPVQVDNDANAFLWGEFSFGAGRGHQHILGYTLGTGIGGGMVLDGKLYHGSNGFAGELGHVMVEMNGAPCSCGSRGCMEAYIGTAGILRNLTALLKKNPGSTLARLDEADRTPKAIHDAALEGDQVALQVVNRIADYLAAGVGSLVVSLNPELIIMGGGISGMGETLLEPFRRKLAERIYIPAPKVALAELGGAVAGIVGAAALVIKK